MKLSIQLFLFLTGSLAPTVSGSPTTSPLTDSSNQCAGNSFQLNLRQDSFGTETTWTLSEEISGIVAYGGPYDNGPEIVHVYDVCLDPGCYDLTVFDEFGDGMCCELGDGSISFTVDGNFVEAISSTFGFNTTALFCTSTLCDGNSFQLNLRQDSFGTETTWTLSEEMGDIVASGGPYDNGPEIVHVYDVCLDPGCYELTIFDLFGDGMCCELGDGSISFTVNGELGQEVSSTFGFNTTASFCTCEKNDWTFKYEGQPGRSCGWVKTNAEDRCRLPGVKDACAESCCGIDINPDELCGLDDWNFKVDGVQGQGCMWVDGNPEERCMETGAKDNCQMACCDID